MAFKEHLSKKFVFSKDIRVFPCAYRGYYKEGEDSKVFDPEARATTESNFADTFSKLSLVKSSYIVDWSSNQLKCVIGGYYFEISDCTIEDFFYYDVDADGWVPYSICISRAWDSLSTSAEDGSRGTTLLTSFTKDSAYLDTLVDGDYIFTGLCLISSTDTPTLDSVAAHLTPFKGEGEKNATFRLNYSALAITELLDSGEGKFAIRMISDLDDEDQRYNHAEATGDYAAAFGKRTKATADFGVVFGNKSESNGESALAFGEESKAQEKGALAGGIAAIAEARGAVALGDNVTATGTNQVVIGTYNKLDNTQAFIVANGTTARNANANKFTVSYAGDVQAKGTLAITGNTNLKGDLTVAGNTTLNSTLTIKGDILAHGTTNNNLVLGTSTIGSYGSISVYGEEATKVFEATKTGNMTIAGVAKSRATTSADSATTLTTKGFVEDLIATGVSSKANATDVEADLNAAIEAAKTELKRYNDTKIAQAVKEAKEELLQSVSDDFAERDTTDTPPTTSDGNGKYVQSVSQTNGQIATVEGTFTSSISSSNTVDAPTSAAVHSHVNTTVSTAISNIWNQNKVKASADATALSSLKSIILNATYPVGSIFVFYSEKLVQTCPIQTELGGTWEPIEAGTFLVAASSENKSIYTYSKTGGSADAVTVLHEHPDGTGKITIDEGGSHAHNFKFWVTAHDGSSDNCFRSAQSEKGGGQTLRQGATGKDDRPFYIETAGAHSHTATLSDLKLPGAGESGANKNLPPFLAVYMWRRVEDPVE